MKFLCTKCLENSHSCERKKTNFNKHLQRRIIRKKNEKTLDHKGNKKRQNFKDKEYAWLAYAVGEVEGSALRILT